MTEDSKRGYAMFFLFILFFGTIMLWQHLDNIRDKRIGTARISTYANQYDTLYVVEEYAWVHQWVEIEKYKDRDSAYSRAKEINLEAEQNKKERRTLINQEQVR